MDQRRRHFLHQLFAAGISAGALSSHSALALPAYLTGTGPKIYIIGGGFGGLAAARELALKLPKAKIILVEPKHLYTTGPTSNWALGGLKRMSEIQFSYDKVASSNISVIHDWVTRIDPERREIFFLAGGRDHYDKLIVSPGIAYDWSNVEGINDSTQQKIPAAYKDAQNTYTLIKQLQYMPNGGTVAICVPPEPYRCPPAPYERASMIALYLKRHKPKSKVLIFDSKDEFGVQPLFEELWRKHYGYGSDNALIEWVSAFDGGNINRVDPQKMMMYNAEGDAFKMDIINFIPKQVAHNTARNLELTDLNGWCPVQPVSFESSLLPHIHVIGDAATTNPLPKSGFSAMAQGRAVANWLLNEYDKPTAPITHFANRCYMLASPDEGVAIQAEFDVNHKRQIIRRSMGVLPDNGDFQAEARNARTWYQLATESLFS